MQTVQSSKNVNSTPNATAGTVLANNPARVYFSIQNVGVAPLYVFFGSTAATASNCHRILAPGATASDGTGDTLQSGDVCYTGPITVGGTGPTCLVTEIAP